MPIRALVLLILLASPLAQGATWKANASSSQLGFLAKWEGSEFEGRFHRWSARLDFAPAAPGSARLEVRIDTTSINTDSEERDALIGDPEWFAFQRFPQAVYEAKGFERLGTGEYRAMGTLTLKGVRRTVPIRFRWSAAAAGDRQATMRGGGTLNRTDFRIGEGEFASGDIIALEVAVKFDLRLEKE